MLQPKVIDVIVYGNELKTNSVILYIKEQKIIKKIKEITSNKYFLGECQNKLDLIKSTQQLDALLEKSVYDMLEDLVGKAKMFEFSII